MSNENNKLNHKYSIKSYIFLYSLFFTIIISLSYFLSGINFSDKVIAIISMAIGIVAFTICNKDFYNKKINSLSNTHLLFSFAFLFIAFAILLGKFSVAILFCFYAKSWYKCPARLISFLMALCLFLTIIMLGAFIFNAFSYALFFNPWIMLFFIVAIYFLYKKRKNSHVIKYINIIKTIEYKAILKPFSILLLVLSIVIMLSQNNDGSNLVNIM